MDEAASCSSRQPASSDTLTTSLGFGVPEKIVKIGFGKTRNTNPGAASDGSFDAAQRADLR